MATYWRVKALPDRLMWGSTLLSQLSRRLSGLYAPIQDHLRPASRLELHYTITPVDLSTGRLGHTMRRRAHSWTLQAASLFDLAMLGSANITIKETDATSTTETAAISPTVVAIAGALTSGIVVGTGTGAESPTDFVIGTVVAEGVGAGQLSYSAMTTFAPPSAISGGYRCRVSRQVDNTSGGTIVVTEIALYFITSVTYCGIRDLLATSQSILTNTGRVIEYQMDFLN